VKWFSQIKSYFRTVFSPWRHRLDAGSLAEREERREVLSFTFLRLVAGGILIPHGVSQLFGANESIAALALAQSRFVPTANMVFMIIFLELIGGICITIGLFMRAFAGALAAANSILRTHRHKLTYTLTAARNLEAAHASG